MKNTPFSQQLDIQARYLSAAVVGADPRVKVLNCVNMKSGKNAANILRQFSQGKYLKCFLKSTARVPDLRAVTSSSRGKQE